MVNPISFLSFLQMGGNVVEPFTRVLLGGGAKKSSKRTNKKTKKIKMKKNLSRKKATRRKNLSNKKSLIKRTKNKKRKHKRTTTKRKVTRKKRECTCDSKRFYSGSEPSPKGLGFCAHCTPENITMKGLDGNLWRNEKYSKGKRWVKL